MNTQPARLIRLPVVIEHTGYGKSWIYHLINEGCFLLLSKSAHVLLPLWNARLKSGFC